jgi:hypothetical protein
MISTIARLPEDERNLLICHMPEQDAREALKAALNIISARREKDRVMVARWRNNKRQLTSNQDIVS